MGGILSFFRSGTALLSAGHHKAVSDATRSNIEILFDALTANPKITVLRLEGLLHTIPRNENVLSIYNGQGYNLLQKAVGINHVEMVKWVLTRNVDVNRGVCSLPLHVACYRGFVNIVEILLKAGARVDIEGRMCWPGYHNMNCELRHKYNINERPNLFEKPCDKSQNAIHYALDGDHVEVLSLLIQQCEDRWLPWQQKRPILHLACEKGAWNCVKHLIAERSDEINQCYDEYYPIHQAALHDVKFLEVLINAGADTSVKTSTQQMTLLHVLFLRGQKSFTETLEATKFLLQHGLKELINTPDSLGNTPLHALFVRYALEEGRFGYELNQPMWSKWDLLHMVRYLIHHGSKSSINQPGNSAIASVLRHVRDWEFRYELLDMLLSNGGNPNLVGRDGSVPLMVCLVPLINKGPFHHFNHTMKVYYLNSVRILCRYGANPNCCSRPNLTPLHVLMFTASEAIDLSREEMKEYSFSFLIELLVILLQHGLDPNVKFSDRSQHILLALMDMVQNARSPIDLNYTYQWASTLIQYGANPNVSATSTEPIICQNQSSVFLKKTNGNVLYYYVQILVRCDSLVKDPQRRFTKLLYLYYYTMDHIPLYRCLRILYTQSTLLPMKEPLASIISELYSNPRSLKQICRISIYNSLNMRPGSKAAKLPLPPKLKDYLTSFEQ